MVVGDIILGTSKRQGWRHLATDLQPLARKQAGCSEKQRKGRDKTAEAV